QISGNARIYGSTRVSGNARIYGSTQVSGNTWISGNAQVFGDAQVSGNARISGKLKLKTGFYFGMKYKGEKIKELKTEDDDIILWKD
ncbi:MAG: hypothetical protein AAB922_05960, partial [Patescibacteria group bacterium]